MIFWTSKIKRLRINYEVQDAAYPIRGLHIAVWTLAELFILPKQLSGGYQALAKRTNQPHADAFPFNPNRWFQLLIGPAYFTMCCHLLHILDTTGVMPGIRQRWQNHGKVMTQPGFKPGTFRLHVSCSNHWATGLDWVIMKHVSRHTWNDDLL